MIGAQRARIKHALTPLRHHSPTRRGLSTHYRWIMAAVNSNAERSIASDSECVRPERCYCKATRLSGLGGAIRRV
jgi:hypothetical protein